MQAQLRHQQLLTTILVLHLLQPLRLVHVHAAVLLLPLVERRRADSMLTTHPHRVALDRLGRNLADLIRLVSELEQRKINFESITEKIETLS